jgi:two-component system phosphate regulon response regulator PhoB
LDCLSASERCRINRLIAACRRRSRHAFVIGHREDGGMPSREPVAPAPAPAPAGPRLPLRIVLLLLPDEVLRELLASALRAAGCYVVPLASADEGRRLAAQLLPDLVLLDIDEGPESERDWALDLVRRSTPKRVHLVMLTSSPQQRCGPAGAACGAERCLAKPVDANALVDELLRLMREATSASRPRPPLRVGPIELERQHPTLRIRHGEQCLVVDLPHTEHRLLEFLLLHPGRVRSREEIRQSVWQGAEVDLRTVDQYIRRLRRSLQKVPGVAAQQWIQTVNRAGYRLAIDDPAVVTVR